jgi:hypothetical protein
MTRGPNHRTRMEGAGARRSLSLLEAIGAGAALAVGMYFLALRIRGGGLPAGDEGSWLAVASEIARGRGFTTRWLEAHFLLPYSIPRPDDFRYPMLTSLVAVAFKGWGFSIEAARWTVAGTFLAFAASTWFLCRSAFGRWAALAGLWLMTCSLLQLEWNAAVYTEGMFGWIATCLAAWCLWGERSLEGKGVLAFRSPYWWAILGAAIGLLYLVRVNGILFLAGVFWLFWRRRKAPLSWKHPTAAIAAFALVAAPWLIRTWIHFGSPFHIAGSAGLLREPGQTHTLTFFQYFANHESLFPLRRMAVGTLDFFRVLDHYEHGLEAAPLLLAVAAACMRRPFFGPCFTAGFLLSFAASCYASYNNWAGVRYMSGLLPLVYAYGLSALTGPWPWKKPFQGRGIPFAMAPWLPSVSAAAGIALLLLPVVNPHRYHERRLSQAMDPKGAYPYRRDLAEHLSRLDSLLPAEGRYYAGSLCGVNFLSEAKGCVGLQELYDPTWFPRSMEAFRPGLIALTHAETRAPAMLAALERMHAGGYREDTVATGAMAVYLSLRPESAPPDTGDGTGR